MDIPTEKIDLRYLLYWSFLFRRKNCRCSPEQVFRVQQDLCNRRVCFKASDEFQDEILDLENVYPLVGHSRSLRTSHDKQLVKLDFSPTKSIICVYFFFLV